MKFAVLALLGLAKADHLCDDINTGEVNSLAGPLATALQKALDDKNAAEQAYQDYIDEESTAQNAVQLAEENVASAQADFDFTEGKITEYHQDYSDASAAFADCQPDDVDSDCTKTEQQQLRTAMIEAGNVMLQNDEDHNTNRNTLEQMTLELNRVTSEAAFESATTNTSAQRLIDDRDTSAQVYQNLLDSYEQHSVSNSEAQESCKINQYNNDIEEINRLDDLIELCSTVGCTQADADIVQEEIDELEGEEEEDSGIVTPVTPEPERNYMSGKIRFPDCGQTIQADCFWLHYEKSGWLDFLSFCSYIPAVLVCAAYDEYDYSLCVGNLTYILVDSMAKKAAPPEYSFIADAN